jgi:hypothetical protein
MSNLKSLLILVTVLALTSLIFVSITFAEPSEYQAATALIEAEQAILVGYQAVLEAEETGANVSSLLVQLNEAGQNLTMARTAYRMGDFVEATDLANLSRNTGEEVRNTATELKESALNQSMQQTLFTMTASIVGMALIALGSLWTWHFLKRRYSTSKLQKTNRRL